VRLVWSSAGIDVVQFNLDRPECPILLSEEEHRQATSMGSAGARRRFAARRSVRRLVLSERCGIAPLELDFDRNSFGKPMIKDSSIWFSSSSSGLIGVLAISDRHEVGIDVQEATDNETLLLGLDAYISDSERLAIGSVGTDLNPLLHRLWTRKEAAAKALGIGLTEKLRHLDVLGGNLSSNGRSIRFKEIDIGPDCGCTLAFIDEESG